jgi:predicted dehydrogenase
VKTIKLGLIGSGFVGQVAHIINYYEQKDVRLQAICELRPILGNAVAGKYGIKNIYTDYQEMLLDTTIDAVIAVVQRAHTGPIALDVLKSQKHLFTEKPMAQTKEKARLLVKQAKKGSLVYGVGFMRRYEPAVQYARKTIAELKRTRRLGDILSARLYLSAGGDYCNIDGDVKSTESKLTTKIWPSAPTWLSPSLEKDYEHFVNVCGHDINLLRFLFDETPKVSYVEYKRNKGKCAVLQFSEFPAVFEWADTQRPFTWEEGVEVQYQLGTLRLELPPAFLRNVPAKVTIQSDKKPLSFKYEPVFDLNWAFKSQTLAFIKAVRTNTQPLANGYDALNDYELIDEIWGKINTSFL